MAGLLYKECQPAVYYIALLENIDLNDNSVLVAEPTFGPYGAFLAVAAIVDPHDWGNNSIEILVLGVALLRERWFN